VEVVQKEVDVKRFKNIIGNDKGGDFLIIGSGGSIKEYEAKIHNKYLANGNCVTIGINKMTDICVPDYHLWTNKQRYRDLGDCINPKSKFLFGKGMPKDLIRKHYAGEYTVVDFIDKKGTPVHYNHSSGMVEGFFRTAGCLSIMLAHLLGAKSISVVGMDGYTLYSRKELKKMSKNHHCYGAGYTDNASWKKCIGKDKMVDNILHSLSDYGIGFSIVTPTKFSDFYDNQLNMSTTPSLKAQGLAQPPLKEC
jgi:hypothetical protein